MRYAGLFWLLLSHLILLRHVVAADMTCNSDGVKCVAYPSSCTSDCDYLLKYKAASADTTQIEISGKPSAHSVSSDNLWLGFGLSSSGRMSGMTVFACQKYGNSYSVGKRSGWGWGVSSSSTNIADGDVVGSLTDGVMNCKCTIKNSNLISSDLKMGYGMGIMGSADGMNKHSRTPRMTSDSFSLIQQYNAPTKTCSKPSVQDGTISPDSATINSGAQYTVTCKSGYTLAGSSIVSCTDGNLGNLPTCNPSPCSKPTITDGTVSPDSATVNSGSQYTVTCKSGYTISGSSTVSCTNGVLSSLPTCNASKKDDDKKDDDKKDDDKSDDKTDDKPDENKDTNKCDLESGCFQYPTDCTPSTCTYSIRWSNSSGLIKIQQTGKLNQFSMSDSTRIWVGFGLSKYGTMANSKIYLCKKNDNTYSAVRVDGYSHGLTRSSTVQLTDGAVSGSVVDGVLNCTFHLKTSQLPSEALTLFYGMGPVKSDGLALNHYKTPTTTSNKVNLATRSVGDSSSQTVVMNSLILTLGLLFLLL